MLGKLKERMLMNEQEARSKAIKETDYCYFDTNATR